MNECCPPFFKEMVAMYYIICEIIIRNLLADYIIAELYQVYKICHSGGYFVSHNHSKNVKLANLVQFVDWFCYFRCRKIEFT